ncbi:D-alanyl-D-alanine carboxypeptidase [Streptomyces sp. JNUCC 64]
MFRTPVAFADADDRDGDGDDGDADGRDADRADGADGDGDRRDDRADGDRADDVTGPADADGADADPVDGNSADADGGATDADGAGGGAASDAGAGSGGDDDDDRDGEAGKAAGAQRTGATTGAPDADDGPAEALEGDRGPVDDSASAGDPDRPADAPEGRTGALEGAPEGDADGGTDADEAPEPRRAPDSASAPETPEATDGPAAPTATDGDAEDGDDPDEAAGTAADGATDGQPGQADESDAADESGKPEDEPDDEPKGADADRADAASGPAVDQATAVFRTAKAPPRVDQPTTTLQFGKRAEAAPGTDGDSAGTDTGDGREDDRATTATDGGAPPGPEAPEDGTPAGKGIDPKGPDGKVPAGKDADRKHPERDQERTSKFVALKPLDGQPATDRRPAAPPSWAAKATGTGATATGTAAGSAGASAATTGTPPRGARVAPDGTAADTSALPAGPPEPTTQQPLPPRPPLDLLAELTNTPPPPQTPLRTAARRVKIWTPLVLLLVIVFAVAQMLRPLPEPTLTLTTDRTHTFKGDKVSLPWPEEGHGWMDVNGVGTMDRFGEQKPVPIGSVAKAMTAYVILKEHPLKPGADGAKIPVDRKAEEQGGLDSVGESTLNTLKEGDEITQKDAIAAIMIPSANNIARLLARWDSSEKEFVAKMNQAAEDLGMENTTYTDPSGLNETTVSTAEDQVKLGHELVRMKALTDITKLPVWTDQTGKEWQNYNRLVPYDGAIGIKTGTTTKAGGNLLFAGTKKVGGETAIVVGAILGQHKPPIIDTVNAVSKTAMIAAQGAVKADVILKKGAVVGHVDDGLGTRTPVVVTEDVSAVGFAGHTVKVELSAAKDLAHSAAAGERVGTLKVGDGSGGAVEVPVALQSAKSEPGFGPKLTRLG